MVLTPSRRSETRFGMDPSPPRSEIELAEKVAEKALFVCLFVLLLLLEKKSLSYASSWDTWRDYGSERVAPLWQNNDYV